MHSEVRGPQKNVVEVFVLESSVKKQRFKFFLKYLGFLMSIEFLSFLKKRKRELIFFPELDGSGLGGFRSFDLIFIFAWEWEQTGGL